MQYVALSGRCAVAVVFLAAVIGKVHSRAAFRAFRQSVPDFVPLKPGKALAVVAVAVVSVEAAVVVLLAIDRTAPAGLGLAGAALLTFSAGIRRAVRSGSSTSCRCFGVTSSPLSGAHLVRNVGLAVVAVGGLAAHLVGTPAVAQPAGAAVAFATAFVLALAFIFLDDLRDLFTAPSRADPSGRHADPSRRSR